MTRDLGACWSERGDHSDDTTQSGRRGGNGSHRFRRRAGFRGCAHVGGPLAYNEWLDAHAFWLPGELQVGERAVAVLSDEDVDFAGPR